MEQNKVLVGVVSGTLCFAIGLGGAVLLNSSLRSRLEKSERTSKMESQNHWSLQKKFAELKAKYAHSQKQLEDSPLRAEIEALKKKVDEQQLLIDRLKQNKTKHPAMPEDWREVLEHPTIQGESAFNAMELCGNERFNWTQVKFKLRIAAIDLGIDDTSEFHSILNKAEENHKERLQTSEWLRDKGILAYEELYEQLRMAQKLSHQKKLEFIKQHMLSAFQEVEQAEQIFYEGIKTALQKELSKGKAQ